MKVPDDTLTEQRILAWAQAKEPLATIGVTCDEDRCPLAHYLNETHPLGNDAWWVVDGEIAYPNGEYSDWSEDDDVSFPLPDWLKDVVQMIDASDEQEAIPAEEFARVVRRVVRLREEIAAYGTE